MQQSSWPWSTLPHDALTLHQLNDTACICPTLDAGIHLWAKKYLGPKIRQHRLELRCTRCGTQESDVVNQQHAFSSVENGE